MKVRKIVVEKTSEGGWVRQEWLHTRGSADREDRGIRKTGDIECPEDIECLEDFEARKIPNRGRVE